MNDANLQKLEKDAKEEALREIADKFMTSESLEKLEDHRERFDKIQQLTESQLKSAMHSQLDGVRTGLNKLDTAWNEARRIRERINEVTTHLEKLHGLSRELDSLRKTCQHYHNLDATMNHMKEIALVPSRVREAHALLANSQYLQAHKIIQELEGMQNDIMFDIHQHDPRSPYLEIVEDFFKSDLDQLNKDFHSFIMYLAATLLSAVISNSKLVVTAIRLIDREERADKVWLDRKKTYGFLPPGRPKAWKAEFFVKFNSSIKDKICGSAVDDEMDRVHLVRHLENVRYNCQHDLMIAKNLCPPFFPEDYEIFLRIFESYHVMLGDFANEVANEISDESKMFQFLCWINSVWSNNFLGYFQIDLTQVSLKHPPDLIREEDLDKLRKKYLKLIIQRFQTWKMNTLNSAKSDWTGTDEPSLDGNCFYYTVLSSSLLSPLAEYLSGMLDSLGSRFKEHFFVAFTKELIEFTKVYQGEVQSLRNSFMKNLTQNSNPIPKYMEFLLANANDCDRINQRFTDSVNKQYQTDPAVLARMNTALAEFREGFQSTRNLCLDYATELILVQSEEVLKIFVTKEWLCTGSCVASELVQMMDHYRHTAIAHLMPPHDVTITRKMSYEMCKKLLITLFSQKFVANSDRDRVRLAERLHEEAKLMKDYFNDLGISADLAKPYDSLMSIHQILLNSDKSMLSLDIYNMQSRFPDLRQQQLLHILSMRNDTRNEAKQMASDYISDNVPASSGSGLHLFTDVANAMKPTKGLLPL